MVDDLNPTWDETFKIIIDDPSQSVQVVVGDYNALSDDAGVKRFGRALTEDGHDVFRVASPRADEDLR